MALWLFIIIVLEGYVVLSSELLAIRQTIPFTGSGTETVSVIIAAVLMPLAFGYAAGGKFQSTPRLNIRKKLILNILIAMAFLLPGLSYIVLDSFFGLLSDVGLQHRLIQITLYSALFLIAPVYLLGQTIPLISNYFRKGSLSALTGRILFFSTMGSFAGAVISTLVLMSLIGVNNTAALNFAILAGLVFILAREVMTLDGYLGIAIATVIAITGVGLNSDYLIGRYGQIVEHNLYNLVAVKEKPDGKHLYLNNSPSSKYSDRGEKYKYIELAEEMALHPIWDSLAPRHILVIGAGAFTFGYEDDFHRYDFVDIDGNLKRIAEEHILPKSLGENKNFYSMPARAFLTQTARKYDVVLLDTYFGKITMPEHLLTLEFFQQIKEHMKDESVLVMNFVASPNFVDPFSRNLDNTVRRIFPYVSRHVLRDDYQLWNDDKQLVKNVLYMYRHQKDFGSPGIYKDNKNRSFLDRP